MPSAPGTMTPSPRISIFGLMVLKLLVILNSSVSSYPREFLTLCSTITVKVPSSLRLGITLTTFSSFTNLTPVPDCKCISPSRSCSRLTGSEKLSRIICSGSETKVAFSTLKSPSGGISMCMGSAVSDSRSLAFQVSTTSLFLSERRMLSIVKLCVFPSSLCCHVMLSFSFSWEAAKDS